MPQALKISIPGIVSTFIGLFKDTTLVSIIGLLDPLGLSTNIRADMAWNGILWEVIWFCWPNFLHFLFFYVAVFNVPRAQARDWSLIKGASVMANAKKQLKVSDEVAIQITNMNKWYGSFHVTPRY